MLVIDMDTQNWSLTYFFGPDYDRGDPEADNLVRHLVGRPKGDFDDLTHKVEDGIDLIPSHNMLEDVHEFLLNEKNQAEKLGESYSIYHELHRVLREANLRDTYDVLIVDSLSLHRETSRPQARVRTRNARSVRHASPPSRTRSGTHSARGVRLMGLKSGSRDAGLDESDDTDTQPPEQERRDLDDEQVPESPAEPVAEEDPSMSDRETRASEDTGGDTSEAGSSEQRPAMNSIP
ncbi:ParA family protein [Halorarum salinum]